MEISPEMVQDAIKAIIEKHQAASILNGNEWLEEENEKTVKEWLDEEYNSLTKELTEHAYSFAELPQPKWRK